MFLDNSNGQAGALSLTPNFSWVDVIERGAEPFQRFPNQHTQNERLLNERQSSKETAEAVATPFCPYDTQLKLGVTATVAERMSVQTAANNSQQHENLTLCCAGTADKSGGTARGRILEGRPMLTLLSDQSNRDCSGLSRRDFIRIGSLGLGAFSLPKLLSAKSGAGPLHSSEFIKDKSVVLLFLAGGASHIETFDPHMEAPVEIRSVTGEVPTTIPGVTFGGTFPRLARRAHKMAVVRSFSHTITDHPKAIQHVLTAGHPAQISIGSTLTRFRGANHAGTGLPTYMTVTAPEVDPQYLREKERVLNGSGPGALGAAYAPFDPDGGGPMIRNLELSIPRERFLDRHALLSNLDRFNRRVDASGAIAALDQHEQQALDMILRGARNAFDLSKEDSRLMERYDTSRFQIGKKIFRSCTLGRQLLLARRLCEAGCGFVTVQSAGWDMHADINNPGIAAGMEMLGRPLDHAVSAFLEDVEARGLSEKILLVITGDFGRTPKINNRGGRDHWANVGTLAFAGGGLKMGQVVGSSTRHADEPASDPISPQKLMATIMHCVFDVGKLRIQPGMPRELLQFVEQAEPIRELV